MALARLANKQRATSAAGRSSSRLQTGTSAIKTVIQQQRQQGWVSTAHASRLSRAFVRSYGSHAGAPDAASIFKKVSEIDKKLLNHKLDAHTANEMKFQLLEKIKPEVMAVHQERSELGYHYAADGKRIFTREEVGTHNSDTDLWIIVGDKVYNVSTWLEYHPGGMEVLRKNAGKDATQQWHNVGHSYRAKEAMELYHIGYVNTPHRFSGLGEADPPKKFS